jgi:hypothetical protein
MTGRYNVEASVLVVLGNDGESSHSGMAKVSKNRHRQE